MNKDFAFSVTLDGVIFYIYETEPSDLQKTKHKIPLHRHFSHELLYIHEGKERLITPKADEEHFAGSLLLVRREVYHCMLSEGARHSAFTVEIGVPKGAPAQSGKKIARIEGAIAAIEEKEVVKDEHICALMKEYDKLLRGGEGFRTQRGMLLVSVFLRVADLLLERSGESVFFGSPERTRDFERRRTIEQHIERDYTEKRGLSLLASRLFLSERQTGKLVERLMGHSYRSLIMQKRLEMANRLMRQERLSLSEIAKSVGYTSYTGFFVSYQKVYGVAPEYAKTRIAAHDHAFESELAARAAAYLDSAENEIED